jgi:hypothetical protein
MEDVAAAALNTSKNDSSYYSIVCIRLCEMEGMLIVRLFHLCAVHLSGFLGDGTTMSPAETGVLQLQEMTPSWLPKTSILLYSAKRGASLAKEWYRTAWLSNISADTQTHSLLPRR